MKKSFRIYAYFGWFCFCFFAVVGLKVLGTIFFSVAHIASLGFHELLWPFIFALIMWTVLMLVGYFPALVDPKKRRD